jgi:hypothetical protein
MRYLWDIYGIIFLRDILLGLYIIWGISFFFGMNLSVRSRGDARMMYM